MMKIPSIRESIALAFKPKKDVEEKYLVKTNDIMVSKKTLSKLEEII